MFWLFGFWCYFGLKTISDCACNVREVLMTNCKRRLVGRYAIEKSHLTSHHLTISLITRSTEKLVDHHQEMVLLDHVVMHRFEGWIPVVHIDQYIFQNGFSNLFLLDIRTFLLTIWLIIYQSCLLATNQLTFLVIDLPASFHDESALVFVLWNGRLEVTFFIVEKSYFE